MILRTLSLLLLCFTLSSCLDLKFEGVIQDTGAGEMSVVTEVPAVNPLNQNEALPTQQELDAERDAYLAEENVKAEKAGVEITESTIELVGDKKVQRTTLKFARLQDLNAYFNQDEQSKTEISLEPREDSMGFRHKITMQMPEQQDAQQQAVFNALAEKTRITLSWKFPAKVGVISEGGVVSDDGQTVKWEYSLKQLAENGIEAFAIIEGKLKQESSTTPDAVGEPEQSESEETGNPLLFQIMLVMSIMGALLIAYLVYLKVRLSRQMQS
ncbi:hypothetical protein SAMN02745181_0182 [Rubritalea squalenifaciens DSM 18772]|uniref:DUF3153 domain-containing protein n=1 Tax=Rubritalea squalenifaciens DSM 18772 TaxID=1123071 RepID=A0A1M6BDM7_9BACT|nr:hypothetical protein [Rubritalea squalenifaciens]SHI46668.1 hypothetical protein SAMN02745181_0182 [Rubritalea squalenifaciens DSM 18772]